MQIKVYTINVRLPRWLRRALVLGVVPAAVLGICAIVYATAVTGQPDFVAGGPLSASSLNAHLGALQTQIDTANANVASMQTRLAGLQAAPTVIEQRSDEAVLGQGVGDLLYSPISVTL